CVLAGGISSQFVSALLMVASTRSAEILVEGELVSKPYVDMTLEVMCEFGREIEREGYKRYRSSPGGAPGDRGRGAHATYTCPPDATAAGYFWCAAAVTQSRCVIDGLTRQDTQGDVALVEVLEQMGCRVLELPNGLGIDAAGVGEL